MKVNSGQASSTLIPEYIGSAFDKVATVADNIETVTEVADNLGHIKTIGNNFGSINTVSSNIDEIVATSSNIEDVKSVVANIDSINTVESKLENIVTVADNITDVATVSDNIDYVKDVADGIAGFPIVSYIGDTPPTQPKAGATWYCTLDGRNYTWYKDVDSGQWVESSPQSNNGNSQHYFGNWNPNEQKYPVSESYSGLWDVVLNPGQSSVQFDNKTWVSGNKLSYYTNTGIYTQIQTFSEVASVNGYKGAVVLSAADVSADASGTADLAVSQHEAKQAAHQISGVAELQAALDSKYSPTNKPSAADIGADASGAAASAVTVHEAKDGAHAISGVAGLQDALDGKAPASSVAAIDTRVAALETRKSTCLVNAVGTGAPHETVSAALPANLMPNSRYVLSNPFGINTPVQVTAELLLDGKWANPGFDGDIGTGTTSDGAIAHYVQGEGIVIQTGNANVAVNSAMLGGGHGRPSPYGVYSAPCRVFVRKLEA